MVDVRGISSQGRLSRRGKGSQGVAACYSWEVARRVRFPFKKTTANYSGEKPPKSSDITNNKRADSREEDLGRVASLLGDANDPIWHF